MMIAILLAMRDAAFVRHEILVRAFYAPGTVEFAEAMVQHEDFVRAFYRPALGD